MKSKGFTLVELIIVIAVIGVLAAILIPIFSNVIDKANAKSALSDAKNSMEQVIIEGTENAAMPENILIFVKKAKNFYVYGFNRLTDGCLYQSPGNPFKGFSDVQSLINARSWNALQGDTAPDLSAAYTDHDTYGYFYLVPYSGDVPQTQAVRGMRAANEYPEISDPVNGLMTENMGDDVHIYHGVLTDKVNTEEQTQGDTVATPTPAVTPTPSAEPTPQPTDTWVNPPVYANYKVQIMFMNWDGSYGRDGYGSSGSGSTNSSTNIRLDLGLGDNRFYFDDMPSYVTSYFKDWYRDNIGYEIVPIERGDTTFTPVDYFTVHLGSEEDTSASIPAYVYCAAVKRDDAPSDNSSLMAGRHGVAFTVYTGEVDRSGEHWQLSGSWTEHSYSDSTYFYYDMNYGYNEETGEYTPTRIYFDELVQAGRWRSCDEGYHYQAVKRVGAYLEPIDYIDLFLTDPYQIHSVTAKIYVVRVPDNI